MGARDLLAELADAGIQIEADGERLLVAPASKLTEGLRGRLRASKAELLALLRPAEPDQHRRAVNHETEEPLPASARSNIRTCRDCRHRLARGTCAQPDAAGMLPPGHGFGIAWPEPGHASTCPTFELKAPAKAAARPYALTRAQGDAAHAAAWSDADIARFSARAAAIRRRGFGPDDSEDLAELAHLLDVQAEGRALCLTCTHVAGTATTGWRCGNNVVAGMPIELAGDLVTTPQRCGGFGRPT